MVRAKGTADAHILQDFLARHFSKHKGLLTTVAQFCLNRVKLYSIMHGSKILFGTSRAQPPPAKTGFRPGQRRPGVRGSAGRPAGRNDAKIMTTRRETHVIMTSLLFRHLYTDNGINRCAAAAATIGRSTQRLFNGVHKNGGVCAMRITKRI